MIKYKAGFTAYGEHPIETEEWLYSEDYSYKNKIVFLGYDANLTPMPILSSRLNTDYNKEWFKKLKKVALNVTKDFKGEVWLDDVRIKALEGEE